MYSHFSKTVFVLSCLALTIFCRWGDSYAQSEEEMQILRMFYKDKDLVVTSTRHPKPVSQVAENISVVTAKEIEDMNAHTVAEVLNRVPGLFIVFNQDFGASSLIHAQGSEDRHVLVLLDGMPWNFMAGGNAETHSIPVGIIERIEVIKGPASSAWGSSLGGVVNIITKSAGTTKRPTGSITASYGEKKTEDYSAQVSGRAGAVSYYLFAGGRDSDGLRSSREFDAYNLYSKVDLPVSKDINAGLTLGYSRPDISFGDLSNLDITSRGKIRTFFITGSMDASLTEELGLKFAFHHFRQKGAQMNDSLGQGIYGPAGTLFTDNIYDEETTGGSARLIWTHGMHTALLGLDLDFGDLYQEINAGHFLQSIGVPARSSAYPDMDRWAIYINDTIVMGRWTISPGIRYDHNSITGSFVSPSLGLACALNGDTILRASVARGFAVPPLSWSSGGGLFLDPNRSLDNEEVWSYQIGAESSALKYVRLKAGLFRHEVDDTLTYVPFGGEEPAFNDIYINRGEIKRHGLELEAETLPLYNFTLWTDFAYVHLSPSNERGSEDIYSWGIGIRYDDGDSLMAELFGHYVWWDLDPAFGASYDDFIWDLNLNKKVGSYENTCFDIFFTAHNIFDGAQYTNGYIKNPDRWVEAGLRVKF